MVSTGYHRLWDCVSTGLMMILAALDVLVRHGETIHHAAHKDSRDRMITVMKT